MEREELEGAQMMPCSTDGGQHHAWVRRLEMGDAEPLYTVCRWTSPRLRGEWRNSQCSFSCYVFSSWAAYKSLDYTCQVTGKKKRFKKLLKMIYEVSGFHKVTSDKNLKYLVWLLTGNSSTSYFKFYLLKYTRPWPSSLSCQLCFFLCVLSCNFVIRGDLNVTFLNKKWN